MYEHLGRGDAGTYPSRQRRFLSVPPTLLRSYRFAVSRNERHCASTASQSGQMQGQRNYDIRPPPSTLMAWPVMPRLISCAMKTAIAATSSGSIRRFCGLEFSNASRAFDSGIPVRATMLLTLASVIGVFTYPGQMALTVILYGINSKARARVRPSTPCFAAVY